LESCIFSSPEKPRYLLAFQIYEIAEFNVYSMQNEIEINIRDLAYTTLAP
jgi:hypothetical protein